MAGFLLVESEGRTACLDFPCGRLPEELPRRRGAFFVNLLGDNPGNCRGAEHSDDEGAPTPLSRRWRSADAALEV